MKKILLLLPALFILTHTISTSAIAGSDRLKFGTESFKKGDKLLNMGLTAGSVLGYGGGVSLPGVSISYEQGIINDLGPGNLGVGAYFGFQHSYYNYGGYKRSWTNVFFGARAAYHYNFNLDPKFDVYAGAMVGGRIESFSDNGVTKATGYGGFYPGVGVFVGARYQFAGALGGFGEVGRGISYLTIGLDLKF